MFESMGLRVSISLFLEDRTLKGECEIGELFDIEGNLVWRASCYHLNGSVLCYRREISMCGSKFESLSTDRSNKKRPPRRYVIVKSGC